MEKISLRKREQKEGVRDFLTVFFKHKAMILTVFLFVIVVVTVASFLIPPTYEATSSVLVKYGREYLNRSEVGSAQPVMSVSQEEVINSEIAILTSPDLAKKVIETIKIDNIYPGLVKDPPKDMNPLDVAVNRFEKNLSAKGVNKSSVIEVSFKHGNPQIAANALNLLVEFYKEKHLQVFSNPQSSFLEGQVTAIGNKLKESENVLEAFKQKHQVYSLDEQKTLLLKQRTDLSSELMATRNTIDELKRKVASLQDQARSFRENKSLYTQTERDKIIVEAKSRLLALELNEQDLLRKYRPDNLLVVDVRKQIQLVKNFLKNNEQDLTGKVLTGNPIYQEAQKVLVTSLAELGAQKAKLATLSGQLGQLDAQIRLLDLKGMQMKDLNRSMDNNEKNFQTYREKMEEAKISDEMNRLKMANISVIQPAAAPIKPASPIISLNIFLAVIFGSITGLGLAYLSEQNSQGLISPESVEKRLNLAVLAAIPYKE